MNEEIWKPVLGYEGLYEVSDQGRVRSLTRVVATINRWGQDMLKALSGCVLVGSRHAKGYRQVKLCKEGVLENFRVSRSVARHFIPNPENKPQVNHINGNTHEDKAANLEWVTNLENQRHSYECLGRKTPNYLKTPVIAERKGEIKYWSSMHEPAKYGIGASQVANMLAGRQKTCHGFHWRYATPEEIEFYERLAA